MILTIVVGYCNLKSNLKPLGLKVALPSLLIDFAE